MRDWEDEERNRRIDEMYARQHGSGFDDIIEMFVYIVIGAVVVFFIAGFLDNTFEWGLTDWLWGRIHDWTGGVIGESDG